MYTIPQAVQRRTYKDFIAKAKKIRSDLNNWKRNLGGKIMIFYVLIATFVVPIFSSRCPSSCHCTRKAVLCVRSKKLDSLPDFSTAKFTVFYLQNSTIRSIKCENLPDFIEILDIRNTWINKKEACSLKHCPGKTIVSLVSDCSTGTYKIKRTAVFSFS